MNTVYHMETGVCATWRLEVVQASSTSIRAFLNIFAGAGNMDALKIELESVEAADC